MLLILSRKELFHSYIHKILDSLPQNDVFSSRWVLFYATPTAVINLLTMAGAFCMKREWIKREKKVIPR